MEITHVQSTVQCNLQVMVHLDLYKQTLRASACHAFDASIGAMGDCKTGAFSRRKHSPSVPLSALKAVTAYVIFIATCLSVRTRPEAIRTGEVLGSKLAHSDALPCCTLSRRLTRMYK